ncbi:aminotransferase class IV [Nocardia terpenica]|uniref:aminotransferase class IV n=1 Tax=Nocardia terpenica TaxID=455432 RepID=UPI0002DC2FA2|nr:aminotransferase class IV [Nocardia terpenica]NQE85987.1 hypothetical protein [Nocardia terpenica]
MSGLNKAGNSMDNCLDNVSGRSVPNNFSWVDGEWVANMSIPTRTTAVLYGASVFDNCRAWRGADCASVYGLVDHIERFRRSATEALLDLPVKDSDLTDGIAAVLSCSPPNKFVRVRMLAFGADEELCSRRASVVIFALPVEGYAPLNPRLVTSTTRRRVSGDLPRTLKSPSGYLFVRREVARARVAGYDDVVLVNEHDRISEATRSNLVIVNGSVFSSPPTSEGALPGVTKRIVRQLVTAAGFRWESRPIDCQELTSAEGVLLTSSSLGVTAAQSVNDRQLATTEAMQTICARYADLPFAESDHASLSVLPLRDQAEKVSFG